MGDKKIAIIDSSSAILLYKAGIFDCAASAYDLTVTRSVELELTRDDREGSGHFANALDYGLLKNGDPPETADIIPSVSRLGAGERDSITRFLSGFGKFIIIDDGRGARTCRDMNIPYINALLVARILRDCGIIGEKSYTGTFEKLLRVGRYSGSIISFARDCESERLREFYP